jgi:hypothetical protein
MSHAALPANSPTNEPHPAGTRRVLAAVAAGWVVPGLGHFLLGRVRRGVLFAVLLLGCYGLGLAHEGRLALRDQRQPLLTSLQVVANLGIGPLDYVARVFVYGKGAYTLPADLGSRERDTVSGVFRERTRSALSIYGTAYVWTAGLMNLLLLFDIWDVGLGRKP